MTDEREDLELQALERQLDDAFATTRPRRDFEDELWLRMQAKRPFGARLRDAFGALVSGFREAPAIPLGAVALVLIAAVGIGVFASGGLHLNQSSTSGAFSQAAPGPADLRAGEFGRLPTPALHPVAGAGTTEAPSAGPLPPMYAATPAGNLYFGPAVLQWTGQLPPLVQAPVYRYSEPSTADADQFAASLGASPSGAKTAGLLGTYSAQDFSLSVVGSTSQLPREPYYALTATTAFGGPGRDPQAVAIGYLERYSLAPTSPSPPELRLTQNVTRVVYPRSFPLPTPAGPAFLLADWNGDHAGIEVELRNGQVISVGGPMPLRLDSANYRLIGNDDAVRMALASRPATTSPLSPEPVVDLNTVELVYALAVSNGQGFYEPAYLFSGTFPYNGQTYTKRVLVPLVDPSQRAS